MINLHCSQFWIAIAGVNQSWLHIEEDWAELFACYLILEIEDCKWVKLENCIFDDHNLYYLFHLQILLIFYLSLYYLLEIDCMNSNQFIFWLKKLFFDLMLLYFLWNDWLIFDEFLWCFFILHLLSKFYHLDFFLISIKITSIDFLIISNQDLKPFVISYFSIPHLSINLDYFQQDFDSHESFWWNYCPSTFPLNLIVVGELLLWFVFDLIISNHFIYFNWILILV